MSVTLNKEQLKHISNLIEMKGVKYYDVNMELTDHMASEVEEILEKERLTYMLAVKKAFLRYDRFHFMKIEEEKEKKLRKQASKMFRRAFFQFFTFPKIIFTGAIFTLSLFLLKYFSFEQLFIIPLSLSLIIGVLMFLKQRKIFKGKDLLQLKAQGPKYMLLVIIPLNGFNVKYYVVDKLTGEFEIQAVILTLIILSLLAAIEIYNKQLNTLKSQYA